MKKALQFLLPLKASKFTNLKPLLLFSFLLISTTGYLEAQDNRKSPFQARANEGKTGITFIEGEWDKVLKLATSERKLIFVDAYATWCGPCKQLKATTFKDKDAAAFINSHFVNLSLDVEKGQGPDLAAEWKIQGLPTLLVFDVNGKQLAQSVGYIGPEDLIAFAKQALVQNGGSR